MTPAKFVNSKPTLPPPKPKSKNSKRHNAARDFVAQSASLHSACGLTQSPGKIPDYLPIMENPKRMLIVGVPIRPATSFVRGREHVRIPSTIQFIAMDRPHFHRG